MRLNLEPNENNYIYHLLLKDAKERGQTDVANWVLNLADKFKREGK